MSFFWIITLCHKVLSLVLSLFKKMRFLPAPGLTGRSLERRRLVWHPFV